MKSLSAVAAVMWAAYAYADVNTNAKRGPKPSPSKPSSADAGAAADSPAIGGEVAVSSLVRSSKKSAAFDRESMQEIYDPHAPIGRPKVLDPFPIPKGPPERTPLRPKILPGTPREEKGDEGTTEVVAVGTPPVWRCSGTLVAPGVVLTARHCTPSTTVAVGEDVIRPRAVARVVDTVLHPNGLDVALLHLDKALTQRGMPLRTIRDAAAPAGFLRLVGFGANVLDGRSGVGTKRLTDVHVFGWGCDSARARETGCSELDELVIPRRGGKDTCDGDSGGPVLEYTATGFRLVAVTSRPVNGFTERCSDGGIYVRVDRIAPWITTTLSRWGELK